MYEKLQQPMPPKKNAIKTRTQITKKYQTHPTKNRSFPPPNKKKSTRIVSNTLKLNEKRTSKKNKNTTEEKLRGWDFWKSIGSPKYVCAPMVDQHLGLVV